MPWIPDRIGETTPGAGDGEIIQNEHLNVLRDAATISFSTVAERDTYWPAATAPLGALCVTRDTGFLWELTDRSGARRWTPPWSATWGRLAAVIIGGTTITTTAAVIGTATISAAAYAMLGTNQRLVRAQFSLGGVSKAGGAGTLIVTITNSSGAAMTSNQFVSTIGDAQFISMAGHVDFYPSDIPGGVIQLRASVNVGTASNATASPLTITDLGPYPTLTVFADDQEVTEDA